MIRFKKFEQNEYAILIRNGKVVKAGVGMAVIYDTRLCGVLVMPTTAFNQSAAFDDIQTADYQQLNVQCDLVYRIAEYKKAGDIFDFAYTNEGVYRRKLVDTRAQMARQVANVLKTEVIRFIRHKKLREAVICQDELAKWLGTELAANEVLENMGLKIVAAAVLGVTPRPETAKALEAAAREQILKEQDDAIYVRRNAAIEQERIIKENELNTELKVIEKQREKKERELATERMTIERRQEIERMQQKHELDIAAEKIEADIKNENEKIKLIDIKAGNDRKVADTKAYEKEIMLKTLNVVDIEIVKALAIAGMDGKTLIAKAFNDIGARADKIENLNITPDLLQNLMER